MKWGKVTKAVIKEKSLDYKWLIRVALINVSSNQIGSDLKDLEDLEDLEDFKLILTC